MCACKEGEPGYKAISYVCVYGTTQSFPGSSGLVYRGYLNSGDNREIVAIKTCKGI